jgi:hopanoid biosynthesis associated RND transporter like protein HpnN
MDLFSAGHRYQPLRDAYNAEFEALPDRVVVVIRSPSPERAKALATTLARRWEGDPAIERVFYRIEVDALKGKALLYLSAEDLIRLRQRLEENRDLLVDFAASPTLPELFTLVNRKMTTALVDRVFTDSLTTEDVTDPPLDLGFLISLLRQLNDGLAGGHAYRSSWEAYLTGDADSASQDGFLWSEDRQLLFVLVNPRLNDTAVNRYEDGIARIRRDLEELQAEYPETEVGVTGPAILDSDEMTAAGRDVTLASVIAGIGVLLLYFVLFKEVVRPLLAVLTLGLGLAWTMGFTTLTVGHLNIFSIVFMPMLVGLGIDYGSYFIGRYEEELSATAGPAVNAVVRAWGATSGGIATTALATALTFGALLLTGSRGLAELGFIGASGILLTFLATYAVLPALLVLHDRRSRIRTSHPEADGRKTGYLEPLYRYPVPTLTASGLLIGVSVWAAGHVGTDFNLLHLQARGTHSVIWEQRIFESTKQSSLFAELTAGTRAEAARKAAALKALPSVAKVESVASVIPDDVDRKLPLLGGLRPLVADVTLHALPPGPVDLEALRGTLSRISFKMGDDADRAPDAEDEPFDRDRREVARLIGQFLGATASMPRAAILAALAEFQAALHRDLADKLGVLQRNVAAEPITPSDLPPELRARYFGRTGRYRLFAYPSENAWEFEPLTRFVTEVRSVDPDALGTPIVNFEFIRGIRDAYARAGLYALVAIAVLTVLVFRAARPTLLALVPLAVGGLWTLGLMALFQVKFNVANLIAIPLIIAPAVESGIMIVQRYREESGRSPRPAPLPTGTGRAVLFSSLSTVIGFGSLMVSRNSGIFSIGMLLTFGVSAVLIASLAVLPSVLRLSCSSGRVPGEEWARARGSDGRTGLRRPDWPADGMA